MSWLTRLLNVFRSDRVTDDIDREMAFHLAERADDLEAAGLPHDAAQREARRRFGGYARQRENTRDRDLLVWLDTFFTDLRYGLRGLRRNPIFCLAAVLTLAIGIGANTAVFTLLHGLLLRSLPVQAPQELVRIGGVNTLDPRPAVLLYYSVLQQLRRQQRSFVDVSAWSREALTVADPDGTLRRPVSALVSGNAFELMGLQPRLGRLITRADDVPGGPPDGWPVVLSASFWRDRFGSDPTVIGRPLTVSGTPVTIVGVAPASFHGVWQGADPKLYLPLQFITVLRAQQGNTSPLERMAVYTVARLKPGVSVDAANAELAVYQQRLLNEFTPPHVRNSPTFSRIALRIESARSGFPTFFSDVYSAPLYLMQGLVVIVLLLCCVNVSGLMLSKLHERQHEFAVRAAIGAGRVRLMRQYLTESFVIALAGAALGGVAAWYGNDLLLPYFRHPNEGVGMDVQPDRTVFFVTAGLAAATTLFFGFLPAWRAGRAGAGVLLRARSAAQRQIAGRGFVSIQVGLSLVLIVLATLLSQSLARLRGEDPGFDVDHVTIQTAPFHTLPQKLDAKLDLYHRMTDRIAQAPGVRSVAVTWFTPMTGFQAEGTFEPLTDSAASSPPIKLAYNSVGSGYFRTMATRIVEGREFVPTERRRDVCVLNRSAAAALFPHQQALGRYVRSTDGRINGAGGRIDPPGLAPLGTCRVVGIAEDAKFASLREPPPKTIYYPMIPEYADSNLVFLINAATKADAIAGYRTALREHAPTVPLVLFATLREQMDAALGSQRAITTLSTFFGAMALLLSAIGLYGMLSSNVTQRTGEIGIRAALGASRATILRMIVSDALRLFAIGVAIGAVVLIFTVHRIDHMLYGVSAFDPLTLAGATLVLALVALAGSYWPARRAASVDPMLAMRVE